ncbi:MAG: MarC family protein [Gemmataceae bacterium]|nr:MarC family protein [Gemmataceae bacterium]
MEDFFRAAVGFFAVVDPIGNVLAFNVLTAGSPERSRRLIAVISILVAFALLAVFTLAGGEVLDFLGISFASFQISAGILLVLTAIRLVEHGALYEGGAAEGGALEAAVVPLAIPLIAGPGTLALSTSYSTQFGTGLTLAAAATVLAATLAVFLAAGVLERVVHPAALRAIARMVGVLLMAIAVDFIVSGWREAGL